MSIDCGGLQPLGRGIPFVASVRGRPAASVSVVPVDGDGVDVVMTGTVDMKLSFFFVTL